MLIKVTSEFCFYIYCSQILILKADLSIVSTTLISIRLTVDPWVQMLEGLLLPSFTSSL